MRTILLTFCLTFLLGFSYAQDYRFGKVSDEELLQKEHPTDPSADAAILYREVKSEFRYASEKGWYLTTEYFDRLKVYTQKGTENVNKVVRLYQGKESDKLRNLRAFTYTMKGDNNVDRVKLGSDGIFEEDVTKYLKQTKITMPDVQEGSVIEIQYAIDSPFIMNIDEYKLQDRIPIDKIHMSFNAPEQFRFQTYHRGWIPIDVKTTKGSKTFALMVRETVDDGSTMGFARQSTKTRRVDLEDVTYTIDMVDIPAIQEEPFVGNIENYMAGIQFELGSVKTESGIQGYSVTWDDVAKRIYNSDAFGGELQRVKYFEKDLDRLLEGVTDPLEKTQRIYFYVLQKMNWNQLAGIYTRDGVRKAYRDNTGNVAEINLMLTGMLRHARVDAFPVLVSTKSNGIPLFPTINGFNYVITAVQIPQGVLLLDATNKNAEFGILDSHVLNGNGRVIIGENDSSWIALSSANPAVSQTLMSAEINSDLEVVGNAQQRFSGNYALNYRNEFRNLAQSEWEKAVEKRYSGVDFSNITFENLINPMESVTLKFDFETLEGIEEVGGKIFLSPLFFLETKENPFKSEKREYPVDFGYPNRSQIIMNLTVPDGYEVESIPENAMATLAGDMGSYRYLISNNGNILQISVDLTIMQAVIAESQYDILKNFFETLVNKESEKIVLKKI